MLLFGFLFSSTVLAAAQDLSYFPLTIRIENGTVKSLRLQEDNKTLTSDCSVFTCDNNGTGTSRLMLNKRNITDFENGWYCLNVCHIHTIYLTNNQIVEITREMLNDLPASVTAVVLRRNKIEHVRRGIIKNQHLTLLDLSNNYIHQVESRALNKTQMLQRLYLEYNLLTDTEFAATLPSKLKELSLTHNAITEISDNSFWRLGELEKLLLQGNRITVIQLEAFKGIEKLNYLDLSFNPIANVENGAFQFVPLLNAVKYNYRPIEYFDNGDDILSSYKNKTLQIFKAQN